jgi:hypothetical protein
MKVLGEFFLRAGQWQMFLLLFVIPTIVGKDRGWREVSACSCVCSIWVVFSLGYGLWFVSEFDSKAGPEAATRAFFIRPDLSRWFICLFSSRICIWGSRFPVRSLPLAARHGLPSPVRLTLCPRVSSWLVNTGNQVFLLMFPSGVCLVQPRISHSGVENK